MKLTDEERNSLVILQLEKAKVFLKQADEMFDMKYWDKISARLGSFLARMEQLRQKGDYNCIYSISEDEISTIKAPARELIETIEVLLAES